MFVVQFQILKITYPVNITEDEVSNLIRELKLIDKTSYSKIEILSNDIPMTLLFFIMELAKTKEIYFWTSLYNKLLIHIKEEEFKNNIKELNE
jgi:hypothetical protein